MSSSNLDDVSQSQTKPFLANGSNDDKHADNDIDKSHELNIVVEDGLTSTNPMIYRVSQSPPLHLLLIFALQQSLLSIAAPLTVSLIVSEVVCAQKDDVIKTQVLSATFFMIGLSTFMMSTIGVRIPIFQGPASTYIIPLIAMSNIGEWKCPDSVLEYDPLTNTSKLMAITGNDTMIPYREIVVDKLAQLSGTLVLVGAIHFLIGFTGAVGVVMRYVGPVTIVPTIMLVGLYIYKLAVKFCETSWLVAFFTTGIGLLFSLFLSNKKTPIPLWNKKKGFYILWYPLHQVFSLLLAILSGWALSAILTYAGMFPDDPKSKQYLARTDARTQIIHDTDWFIFPYPGKLSGFSFSSGAFASFLIATLMSVLDSIGDYNACARTAHVPPVPSFAFNRGIAVEGIMSMLGGAMGCCHATVSYAGNIGAIGITKVASRRVLQVAGFINILFAIFGKVGAVFITIPYCVLGGSQIIALGIFVGVILAYLQTLDLNSTRNLAIIGIALLLGFMIPYWMQNNAGAIDTGVKELNNIFTMLLSNPSFVGGVFAFCMDNSVPGTLRERGLEAQLKELQGDEDVPTCDYEDDLEIYRLPFIPNSFRKSRLAKYIPIIEYTGSQ